MTWRSLLPALMGGVAVLVLLARVAGTVVTHLEQRGFALAHQCLPDGGSFAWLGMHLAVVRTSPDCPAGTVALGGRPDDVAAVIAAIALPVLVSHLLGGFAGVGLAAYLSRAFERCVGLMRALWSLVRGTADRPILLIGERRSVIIRRGQPMPRRLALALAPVRRGPPVVLAF